MRSIKIFLIVSLASVLAIACTSWSGIRYAEPVLYKASDARFQYTGRIDFSNKELPRFWSPGVYIKAAFSGTVCEVELNDEVIWGKDHNYVSIAIDDMPVKRIKLSQKNNVLKFSEGLADTKHVITICKSTESNIGYLEFVGLRCRQLLDAPARPKYKMEFIGNSITCGTGSDVSEVPCDKGAWYDQHNAYMSYGALTARGLNADYHLSSVSGIGLTHSCCNLEYVMPQVFDKVNLRANQIPWDFSRYQPDVVTVCLGQNDGIVDSAKFCPAYVSFIKQLRGYYPSATIVCLTSPMAAADLLKVQKSYLPPIVSEVNKQGDKNVYSYFFSKRYHNGCGDHPDLAEHRQIANELITFIAGIKHWNPSQLK